MNRRSYSLSVMALVAVFGIAACGSPSAEGQKDSAEFDPDKQYEIVFESYNLDSATWDEPIRSLVEQFEDEYPNVKVTPQASGDSTAAGGTASSVQRQLLAGNPPDVVQLTFDTLGYSVSDLQAQPLDEIVGGEEIEAHFDGDYPMHPNVRDFGRIGEHVYGIPYVLSTPVLYYNKTAVEEAGIENPDFSSWDSLQEIAEVLSEDSGAPSFANSCLDPVGEWCYQSLVRSAGGQVLSEDRETILAGETQAVAPIARMQEMQQAGVLQNADFNGQYEGFAAGQTQIHLNSASMQGAFQAGAEEGGWELGAAAMPGVDGQEAVPVSSGSMLSIFSQDPDTQAAAWEFTKFMTSETAYEAISPLGYLPLRTTMVEDGGPLADWADEQEDLLDPNLAQLENVEPWVSYPGGNYVQISTVIMDAVEEVAYQGADPEKTIAEAQERAQELVE